MSRKLTVTRLRERRKGWSYRAFDFQLLLNGMPHGAVKDGQSVSFSIPEDELLLEIWPLTVNRRPSWCAIIPAGKDDYRVVVAPWLQNDPTVEQTPAVPINQLSCTPCPAYLDDMEVDSIVSLEDCFTVRPDGDLDQIVAWWLDGKIEPTNGYDYWNRSHRRRLILILTGADQVEYSTKGNEALRKCCLEHDIDLMLDLGDGYYQNLTTGHFFVLKIGETWVGNGDFPYTYGQLEWELISAIPPRYCKNNEEGTDSQCEL